MRTKLDVTKDNLVKHDSNAWGSKEDFNMKILVDFISNLVLLHNVSEEWFFLMN